MKASIEEGFPTDQTKGPQILGIGTPVIDYFISVSDQYIHSLAGTRGGSIPVDLEVFQQILHHHPSFQMISGGSTANTIKGLARLGHSCALIGKIGQDEQGVQFSKEIASCRIIPHFSISPLPTARAACLITPDGERTIRCVMGAGLEMNENDLHLEYFNQMQHLHIEGYLMSRQGVVEKAMQLAKERKATISFDLSSFEIIKEHKKAIIELVSNFVDILFANEEEAQMLTGLQAEKACSLLKDLSNIAIVKMGSQGCWAATKTKKVCHQAFHVKAIDTTGAGDLFASGFLHGFLTNKSLEESLGYASFIASEVIQIIGAEIPEQSWPHIKRKLACFPKHLHEEMIALFQEG